jgi:hypothetical protein
MTRHMKFFVCLIATLSAGSGLAQEPTTSTTVSPAYNSPPVALVYASTPSHIYAYSASSSGKLTPVPGSPFAASEGGVSQGIVSTGKYLFAINANGNNIDSFSVASDGALKKVASIDAIKFNDSCGGDGGNAIFSLFLDHTGSILYDLEFNANICANNAYQYFSINKSTGELTYRGVSTPGEIFEDPLSFSGNNDYAYDSNGYRLGVNIFGFKRSSTGELTFLGMNPEVPNAKSGSTYLPYLAAPDPTNHLAITLQPYNDDTQSPDGPTVLATYSGADSGKLTTTSTHENMPAIEVNNVNAMNMSPSGKLLAIAGSSGLQVFHFNGGSPITHYTGLLTTDAIDQIFWDSDNHLYAISHAHGKLFVFDATTTKVSPAFGSPYSIGQVQNLAVVSK